jgi:superfamily I DNA and/or RNA helicase
MIVCTEEPLALCALAGLAGPSTSVVLAGDPKQLGPVIHSGVAKEAGLGVSLLERLTSMAPYAAVVDAKTSSSSSSGVGASRGSAEGLIVKLVKNYRSHEKLLQLPSQLFYQGELQACATPDITHTLLHWDTLPNKE